MRAAKLAGSTYISVSYSMAQTLPVWPQQPLRFSSHGEGATTLAPAASSRSNNASPAAESSPTSTLNEKDVEKQNDPSEKNDKQDEEEDPNLVDFDGPDDPMRPMNWPHGKKWLYATCLGLMTLVVTFASSVFSTATEVTSMEFGVSTEVMTLGTSLFVVYATLYVEHILDNR